MCLTGSGFITSKLTINIFNNGRTEHSEREDDSKLESCDMSLKLVLNFSFPCTFGEQTSILRQKNRLRK